MVCAPDSFLACVKKKVQRTKKEAGYARLYRLHSITATAYVSLGLSSCLLQESYAPSLGTFQTILYLWYLLTTIDTTNTSTILASHMMIK